MLRQAAEAAVMMREAAVPAVAKATDMERVAEAVVTVVRVAVEVAVAGTLCSLSMMGYHTQHAWFARPCLSTAHTECCRCLSDASHRATPLMTGGMSRAN